MQKIKNIEILRFIFILIIALYHIPKQIFSFLKNSVLLYNTISTGSVWGCVCVDFFFIIAGFFLFLTTDFKQDFYKFAKKKFLRLMPLMVFAILLILFLSFFTTIKFNHYGWVFAILNIQNIGITFKSTNIVGGSWFVSALFWGMCFYFYLYKTVNIKIFNLITALIILFCFSFLVHTFWISDELQKNYLNEYYIFNNGLMRALSGLGIGYFLSMLYKDNVEKLKEIYLSRFQKVLFSVVEIYLLLFLVYYTCFHKISCDNVLILIISFIILFILFICKFGYFSRFLENDVSVYLGKFTFSIYLTHMTILRVWREYIIIPHSSWVLNHYVLNLVLMYILIITFGILVYYLYEVPVHRYLKRFIK